MSVSQAGTFSIQEFTDAGIPLALGRLYTYATGTTTQKIAYTDAAGLVPHSYTLDSSDVPYIALNSRGELPAPLYLLTDGGYDLALKRADGSSVWTRRADGVATASDVVFTQAGTGAVARTLQAKAREIVSVTDYGADPSGTADSADAVQRAVTYIASLGGGTVYFPRGTYRLNAKQRTSIPSNNNIYDGHAVVVPNTSNISFVGEDRANTIIKNYAFGGGRNDASWQVVSGLVFRGAGLFFRGGAGTGSATSNIVVRNLTFDGTCVYTGVKSIPANTATGNGWDITQKAIWMENNTFFGRFEVRDCEIMNYRGELIYSGGADQAAPMVVEDCDIHDTNGDGFSGSAYNAIRFNRIYKCAGQGIECDTSTPDFQTVYEDNDIYNCTAGITLALYGTTSTARQTVRNNRISLCDIGILLQGTNKVLIEHNTITDCGFGTGNRAIQAQTFNSKTLADITIRRNMIWCHSRSMIAGILISGTTPNTPKAIRVVDNSVIRTQDAITAGFTIGAGITHQTDALPADLVEYGNEYDSTFQYTTLSAAAETLLATTGVTDVAKMRPTTPGGYYVDIYVEVLNALTTLTLSVIYADSTGTLRTIALEAAAGKAVGVYTYRAYVYAYGASESQYVFARATAGTANNIKVSAQIGRARVSG